MDAMSAPGAWRLPPLIMHPFSQPDDARRMLDGTRASLMLSKLVDGPQANERELMRQLLDGRYCEIRMLFYLGKDLARWIDQCLESARKNDEYGGEDLRFQSFADLLTENLPAAVRQKLVTWGVTDHRRVLSRALGLNSVFARLPEMQSLSEEFLRNYHGFADHMFICSQGSSPFRRLRAEKLHFDLYTSAEYSQIMESGFERA